MEPSKRQENWTLLSGEQSINTSEGRNKLCTFPLTTQSNGQGHPKSVSLGQQLRKDMEDNYALEPTFILPKCARLDLQCMQSVILGIQAKMIKQK